MTDGSPGGGRLDSWKAIASYLGRDIRTVKRWEQELGLPVQRIPGGRGRSVFAYTSQIDEWLQGSPARRDNAGDADGAREASDDDKPAENGSASTALKFAAATLLTGVAVFGIAWWATGRHVTAAAIKVDVTPDAVVAYDASGSRRWRHGFDAAYTTVLYPFNPPSTLAGGSNPAVYVGTSHRVHKSDNRIEGGELLAIDLDGRVTRSFSFSDDIRVRGRSFHAPWAVTDFSVDDSTGARRIAVAAHHFEWEPSIVTVLDAQWRRVGTYTHAGWIEGVRWISRDRLLVAGFSESLDGGMVALVDPAKLDGQGPEAPGSRYRCETCGETTGIRTIVMPRTEVNRVTASRFNRALVRVTPDRVLVRTIEMLSTNDEAVDALYEFTPSLDLVSARFSDRYWDIHRALEMQGKLDHPRDRCPDRDGPREILVWTPDRDWRTQQIR